MRPLFHPQNSNNFEPLCAGPEAVTVAVDRQESALVISAGTTSFSTTACAPLARLTTAKPKSQAPQTAATLAELISCVESTHRPEKFDLRLGLDLLARPGLAGAKLNSKSTQDQRRPQCHALGITLPPSPTTLDFKSSVLVASSTDLPSPQDEPSESHRLSFPQLLPFSQPAVQALSLPVGHNDRLPPNYGAVRNIILTQTPPDDSGTLDWSSPGFKMASGTEQSEPTSGRGHLNLSDRLASTPSMTQPVFSFGAGRFPWINNALSITMDIVRRHNRSDAIKILSHALPSPSAHGHAFPVVIECIQQSLSSNSIMWINVWHAVSGRFSFEDLPKSPPTTPAPPFEGDDYFTQRVFDYAVEVPDYSQKLTPQPFMARTQRPAIAPSSIDVSIVERYIPPTSTAEFEELFSVNGRSFLCDRLIELSPSHGTLLFIYPTKTGGQTFKRQYLEPLLDPVLRSMMISHDLPVTLVEDIGRMSSVEHLSSFEDMKSQLITLLNTLSNTNASMHNRYYRQNANYSLIYSDNHDVHLDRTVWARDWWSKQEKQRIQRAFESHDVQGATMNRQAGNFQAAAHLATAARETSQVAASDQAKFIQRAQTQSLLRDAERSRGERQPGDNEQLILRLLQQVMTKEYRDGPPTKGIELGVFVIQKTSQAVAADLTF